MINKNHQYPHQIFGYNLGNCFNSNLQVDRYEKTIQLEQFILHEEKIRKDSHDNSNISKQNRSQMGIIGDVLDVTMQGGCNGVIISIISRKANLSYYAVFRKM